MRSSPLNVLLPCSDVTTGMANDHSDLFMHPKSASCVIHEVQEDVQPDAGLQQQHSSTSEAEPPATTSQTAPSAQDPTSSASEGSSVTDEQLQAVLAECERLKQEGNGHFGRGEYDDALQLYWQAIDKAPEAAQERAVYLCNAAACYLKKQMWQLAADQCTQALKINNNYLKALVRRSTALRELDDLEHALADAQRVQELDPENAWARKTIAELSPEVQQRQEKMKEEMLGKLKDLGNTLLGKFGLSLDNFKAEKDPNTGGYSIKFGQ